MGATTKSGRTRNRRKIQPSNAPDGYPNVISARFEEWNGTNTIKIVFSSPQWTGWPYGDDFSGTGTLNLWREDEASFFTAAFTLDPSGSFANLVCSENLDVTTIWLPPWQEGVRGMNGEWLAPMLFICLES